MDKPPIKPGERWHFECITPTFIQGELVERVLAEGNTRYQKYIIQDTSVFGRTLVLDDKTQSTALDEFVYHEALVHPAMITHPNPKSVFIAGGGEGSTAREVLSHASIESVIMIDLDQEIVELCMAYLPEHHKGAFQDPRLKVIYQDAYDYLEKSHEKFDVAIIDVPDPLEGGPAYNLFTLEFYCLLSEHMSPNGLVAVQSGPTGPAFNEQCFSAVSNTMARVFPNISLSEAFIPSFGTTWGFIIGSQSCDPMILSSDEVNCRISARINNELSFYDGITHTGMFNLPKYLRQSVDKEVRIITKTNPLFVS